MHIFSILLYKNEYVCILTFYIHCFTLAVVQMKFARAYYHFYETILNCISTEYVLTSTLIINIPPADFLLFIKANLVEYFGR